MKLLGLECGVSGGVVYFFTIFKFTIDFYILSYLQSELRLDLITQALTELSNKNPN